MLSINTFKHGFQIPFSRSIARRFMMSWNKLTVSEKAYGVKARKLEKLILDHATEKELVNFLTVSRYASTEEDYKRAVAKIKCQNLKIDAVITRILSLPRRPEFPVTFINQRELFKEIHPYLTSKEISEFLSFYNGLLHHQKGHLLHPENKDQLMQRLSTVPPVHSQLITDLMVNYRCFGNTYEHCVDEDVKGTDEKQMQLNALDREILKLKRKLGQSTLLDPLDFRIRELKGIQDPEMRKMVYLTFQHLARNDQLHDLHLPFSELINHDSICSFLERATTIQTLETRKEVIKYLSYLKNGDLVEFEFLCLKEQYINLYHHRHSQICQVSLDYQKDAQIQHFFENPSKTYPPGDFSFIANRITCDILTEIYDAFEKCKLWQKFDNTLNSDYFGLGFQDLRMLMKSLSGTYNERMNMRSCIKWMYKIHTNGWDHAVQEYIHQQFLSIGILKSALLETSHKFSERKSAS